jgi:hypothetical protein
VESHDRMGKPGYVRLRLINTSRKHPDCSIAQKPGSPVDYVAVQPTQSSILSQTANAALRNPITSIIFILIAEAHFKYMTKFESRK